MSVPLYLLLGSNIGDRAAQLRQARAAIEQQVGIITRTSAIYETAAWGKKDQAPFLNQVLEISVHPQVLIGQSQENSSRAILAQTAAIETAAGRERRHLWEPRTLDIDLLLWGDAAIALPELTIPHPALPARRFALQPLAEVAGDAVHPLLQRTIIQLLAECPDPLVVQVFEHATTAVQSETAATSQYSHTPVIPGLTRNPEGLAEGNFAPPIHVNTNQPYTSATTEQQERHSGRSAAEIRNDGTYTQLSNTPTFQHANTPFLAIEGVIGAGKTTLAHKLAAHYGTEPLLEVFTDNAFLPRFYAEPARYALPVELHFLTDRHRQLEAATASVRVAPLVADYTFAKCLLFAGVTLPAEEVALYTRLFRMAEENLPKPDVVVYLHADVARLQQSIRSRGREYEQGISEDYLLKLAAAYEAWLPVAGCPVVWVDTGSIDYLGDPAAIGALLAAVESALAAGVYRLEL